MNAYCNDTTGNNNYTESVTFGVDTVAPSINITYPLNAITYNINVSAINYTVDSTGNCWYSNSSGTWNSTTSPAGTNFTNVITTEGTNNFIVYCNDTVGNQNQSSFLTFIKDAINPAINFTSPTPSNGSSQSNTDIFVNVSSSDANPHYTFLDFDNGILLWMRMDDVNGSGDPTDLSSYSNNGSKQGNAVQTDDGYFGKGFSFDGVGDYVNAGHNASLQFNQTNGVTVSAWVKPTSGHEAYSYAWRKGDAKLYAYDTSATSYAVNPSPYESPYNIYITLAPNVWNHVVTVAFNSGSGKNFTAYVNGQNAGSKLYPSPITDVLTNDFSIGADISGNRRYYNGSIDEVMVFNRALSAAEISALYNASANQYNNNFTSLAGGNHLFTGYTVDKAGNKNQTEERSVTIDSIFPIVNITYPLNATTYNINVSAINYTVDSTGNCWYSNSSGTWNSTTSPAGTNFTNVITTEGTNNFIVYCNDTSNNINSSSVTFTKDTTVPTTTILSPANNSNFNTQTINFITNYTNLDLKNATLFVWNTTGTVNQTTNTITGTSNQTNVSVTLPDDGAFTWNSYACDSNDNCAFYLENWSLLVDTINPTINFTGPTPSNGNSQSNTDIFVNVSSSDANDHYTFLDFDNDVLLWMRMDDTNASGDPTDLSSYSNNGTAKADAAQTDDGYFGKGFSFDSDGDYIDLGTSSLAAKKSQFTISSWFKVTTSAASGSLTIYGESDYEGIGEDPWGILMFYVDLNDGSINAYVYKDGDDPYPSITSAVNADDGLWHNAVFVKENSTSWELYFDGASVGTSALSQTTSMLIDNVRIGSVDFDQPYYMNGSIDEVLIFNRSLNLSEVKALYNASANQYNNNFTSLAGGNHLFTGYTVDKAGNKNQTEQRTVRVVNPQAFERLGIPTNPYDIDNAANLTNYDQIASGSDESYYATTLADTDGQYDSQIFIFRTKENTTAIGTLNLTWQGYGETQAGYLTNISLFNWATGNWVGINSTDFTSAVNLTLDLNVVSGVSNYLNNTDGDNKVAVLVTTRKYAVAAECGNGEVEDGETCDAGDNNQPVGSGATSCLYEPFCNEPDNGECSNTWLCNENCECEGCAGFCGFCPFFYSWNGSEYVYDIQIIYKLDSKEEETLQYRNISYLDTNGKIKGVIKEEEYETSYIDLVYLEIIDFNENETIKTVLKPINASRDLNLILESDNRHLITNYGDEVYVEFEDAPVLREGFEREVKIGAEGYYEFYEGNSPFLYTHQNNQYAFLSDFIPGATSKEKEYTSFTDITNKVDIVDNNNELGLVVEVIEEDNKSIGLVMMDKSSENDDVSLDLEKKNKTSNLNSLIVPEISSEVFEVLNRSFITSDYLSYLLINSNGKSFILPLKFVKNSSQFFRDFKLETHSNPISLSSSSIVMGSEGSFLAFSNSLTYSSLTSNSSTGYQSILSQNSWSASDSVLVSMNLSNISLLINLINALPSNLEPILVLSSSGNEIVNSAILLINREDITYLNLSKLEYNFLSDFIPTATSKEKEYLSFHDITNKVEVVSGEGENYPKNLDNSDVVKTLINDCSLKCESLDQIGMFSSNANAKNGESVLCEINLSALSSKKCETFLSSISSGSKEMSSKNFSFEIFDLEQISSEYLNSSSISSLGANNSRLFSFNNLFVDELDLNSENTALVSTTNSIYESSLRLLDMSSLNSLPSLMQSSSVNSEFSKSFSNFSNISSCFIFFRNASLANADQLSHANLSILCLTSSGTDNVIDTILISNTYNTFKDIKHIFKGFGAREYLSFNDITKTETTNGKVKLKITEELDETTYLDRIYLRADGKEIIELSSITNADINLLKESDDEYLIMKQGDEYYLEFDAPESYDKLEFAAEGYYIEHYKNKAEEPHRSLYTNFINLTYAAETNAGPSIMLHVLPIAQTNPTENTITAVEFTATVSDVNGKDNINSTSVNANFTRAGEPTRQDTSCAILSAENTTNSYNFSCTIDMWYFDQNGDWNITVYAEDNSAESAMNTSTTFQYNLLKAMVMSPSAISFAVAAGGKNQTASNDPTLINNTGNYNVSNISITAINLIGELYPSNYIDVGNISVDIDTGGSPPAECSGGTALANATAVNITNSILNRGNHSVNDGSTGQEQLYYCMPNVPSLPTQAYSTSTGGSWTITILAAGFVLRKRKKKRSKRELIEVIQNKLKKRKLSIDELALLDEQLRKECSTTLSTLLQETRKAKQEIKIPAQIFTHKIGPAEALCKFLKENRSMTFHEIALTLNRNDRTIWLNYRNAVKKERAIIKVDKKAMNLPVEIFADRRLSIFETTVNFLRENGTSNAQIAKLLNKDPRNVWTIYSRAVKKLEK
ncbi:MAG: LamG domain-containing protein [Nanoarchaeota archaeon]|nr:LamG domain-containing protein [Nanoarchaeota archaeon]